LKLPKTSLSRVKMAAAVSHVADFLSFVNKSVSPFHAVDQAKMRLAAKGFVEVKEADPWNLKPGGKYFFTRNQSTLFAFALGGKYKPGNGFSIVAAHTDSPCLRVKPRSVIESSGYLQVGVETYGGGLWYTWFDRDLTVGGKVIVQEGNKFVQKLAHIEQPIMRIPTLAIHLDRGVTDNGFTPNKETHLVPVLASSVKGKMEAPTGNKNHHALLLTLLAKNLGCEVDKIRDFELCVADTQPAVLGGALEEFIFSPRLDNICSSYCAVQSLLSSVEKNDLDNETDVRLISLFDHEECGSQSASGADSLLIKSVLKRIASDNQNPLAFEQAIPKSFLISADQAHGVHPNYSDKHEGRHRPEINKGFVIKYNSNQRYATTSSTAFVLKRLAEKYNVPFQEMMVRNDSVCGSTIGSILASNLGIKTVDIGLPQLSMHSIREMGGKEDLGHMISLLEAFFIDYPSIRETLQFD